MVSLYKGVGRGQAARHRHPIELEVQVQVVQVQVEAQVELLAFAMSRALLLIYVGPQTSRIRRVALPVLPPLLALLWQRYTNLGQRGSLSARLKIQCETLPAAST